MPPIRTPPSTYQEKGKGDILINAAVRSKARAVRWLCTVHSSTPHSESHVWESFASLAAHQQCYYQSEYTSPPLVALIHLRVDPEGQQPNAERSLSDQIMFRKETWLNCNLTLSVYFSQGPADSFLPFTKKKKKKKNSTIHKNGTGSPFFFSVTSIWAGRDFTLFKFTKSVAMCIMQVFLFISFFFSWVVFSSDRLSEP